MKNTWNNRIYLRYKEEIHLEIIVSDWSFKEVKLIQGRIIQQLSLSWNIVVSYPVDSSIEREKKTVQRCAYKSVLINDQDYL